ncbi:MAG: glycosyltransferase family 4 protein, partial [Candidatus Acidiferrales bacterium]
MNPSKRKVRLAVVSPTLDKSFGTERIVVEWITRLGDEFDVHVYSQHVEDVDLSQITWHRVPKLPGPHLFNFLWWFAANQLYRAWDRRFRGLVYDLVYSPGINCLDADAISVHIIFAEYVWKGKLDMEFRKHPIRTWPRLLHRRFYYRLVISLERHVYKQSGISLILIARKTATDLERFFGRRDDFPVLYLGLDHETYNPARREALREQARRELGLSEDRFALLLVGNDWRNKGVPVLLDAMTQLRELAVDLLVVSREDPAPVRAMARERGLGEQVRVLPPRKDVEFYYAAADTYAGPSLGDTFAIPPAEAMACG